MREAKPSKRLRDEKEPQEGKRSEKDH